jgi:hypothetical protein
MFGVCNSAVQMTSEEIKDDTTAIRSNTAAIPNIKEDTSRIADPVHGYQGSQHQVK